MTDKEIDADIGRMVRQYTENKRTYACYRNRFDERKREIAEVSMCLQPGLERDLVGLQRAAKNVDWNGFCETINKLIELKNEKTRIEALLKNTGVEI